MLNSPKIEFFKQREFGDKINITFAFIRQNAKEYFKYQIYLAGPFIALGTILIAVLFSTTMNSFTQGFEEGDFSYSSNYSSGYGLLVAIVYLVIYGIISAVSLSFMRTYHENSQGNVPFNEVRSLTWKALFPILGGCVIGGVAIGAGLLFFFFPGIFLLVSFSLLIPIVVFEGSDSIAGLGRSYNLIKGKWWSTAGLLFVSLIIGGVLSYVVQIPVFIVGFVEAFTAVSEGTLEGEVLQSAWFNALGTLLAFLGMIINIFVVQTAMAFQYFNLVEKKESKGLMSKISDMGQA
ncbi:MAG: hypothetical protein ACPF9D_03745, partial [Owenweeksia sp.]